MHHSQAMAPPFIAWIISNPSAKSELAAVSLSYRAPLGKIPPTPFSNSMNVTISNQDTSPREIGW